MWEGENRKGLLQVYMPWAVEQCTRRCAVDGVARGLATDAGLCSDWTEKDLLPCAEGNPLHKVRHWAAAIAAGGPCGIGADPLNEFYGPRGQHSFGDRPRWELPH